MPQMHCRRIAVVVVIAITIAGLAQAQTLPPTATLPDTPVGKEFAGWLAALNSGNRETIRQFVADQFAPPPTGNLPIDRITDRTLARFTDSLGLDLRSVIKSTPTRIAVVVQARNTGFCKDVQLQVTEQPPYKIQGTSDTGIELPAELLPNQRLTDQEIRDNVDGLISKLVQADQFSGVILVAKDGKPIYERATGLASRAWNIPNRMDTKFNIASIGKMFTAVAIAQLVEQGKLSYTDTLAKILPDYPNKEIAQKITLHQLLCHTSGIKQAIPIDNAIADLRGKPSTLKEYLTTGANDTLSFEPGSKLEYSNYGYALLGAIIAKTSSQDYYDYIRQHIYAPAGMANTDCYDLNTDPPNLATGYMDGPNHTRLSNIFMLPERGLPEGLGYSTADDLVKFAAAMTNHALLSPKSLDTVWSGKADYTEPNSQYGYGCIVKRYNSTRIIGHGGGWVGITNKFDIYPDLGYTVVILTNIDSAPNPIAYKLSEWLTQGHQ